MPSDSLREELAPEADQSFQRVDAMLVDAEQNRQASRTMLEMPVLALGGDAFIAERNEKQMKQFARNVRGHVFHAGHDLAEEVPDEMAPVVLPFLNAHS